MNITSILMALTSILLMSGVYRHDVKEERYLELASKSQFDCVGKVLVNGDFAGSCVVIDSNTVLTAAHVLIESDIRIDTVKFNGVKMHVNTPINERFIPFESITIELNGKQYQADNFISYPDYLSKKDSQIDLSIIKLKSKVNNISFPALNKHFNEVNRIAIGVGYGVSGPANKLNKVEGYEKKIAGENVIDESNDNNLHKAEHLIHTDFDHPTNSKCCNKTGSSKALDLEYIPGGGDSGGGLFIMNEDQATLVGILLGTDKDLKRLLSNGYYGTVSNWTRISVFNDWITQQNSILNEKAK